MLNKVGNVLVTLLVEGWKSLSIFAGAIFLFNLAKHGFKKTFAHYEHTNWNEEDLM
jgi:hypothetical protein